MFQAFRKWLAGIFKPAPFTDEDMMYFGEDKEPPKKRGFLIRTKRTSLNKSETQFLDGADIAHNLVDRTREQRPTTIMEAQKPAMPPDSKKGTVFQPRLGMSPKDLKELEEQLDTARRSENGITRPQPPPHRMLDLELPKSRRATSPQLPSSSKSKPSTGHRNETRAYLGKMPLQSDKDDED